MEELTQTRISIVIHSVVAIIVGFLSVTIANQYRTLFAIGFGLVVLYLTGLVAQKITHQKGMKWWAGNGLIIYLFAWFISWAVFINF